MRRRILQTLLATARRRAASRPARPGVGDGPRYSVVVPTRRRGDTLRHTLASVLAIGRDDLEVVVHHAGPDATTEALVAGLGDRRVRYAASAAAGSMRDNWESAVALARGAWITVLGDDDGLLPDALDAADALLSGGRSELLTWRPATYYWPDAMARSVAGWALHVYDPARPDAFLDSNRTLRELYEFRRDYSDLPMIYNSFVSRRLVERVRNRLGAYFHLDFPDVTSGVVNALHAGRFLWSAYPLSVSGISGGSIGGRMFLSEDAGSQAAATAEGAFAGRRHGMFGALPTLTFRVANELALLHESLGLSARGLPLRPADVAAYLARTLRVYPERRAAARAALRELCERNGLDVEPLLRDYDSSDDGSPHDAFAAGPERGAVLLRRDLRPDGVADVAAAARAIARDLGPRRHPAATAAEGLLRRALGGARGDWAFGSGGNGARLLGDGWHQPESFGAWAAEPRATVTLPSVVAPEGARARLIVTLQAPLTPAQPSLPFRVAVRGGAAAREGAIGPRSATTRLDVRFDLPRSDEARALVLDVESGALVNPAKLGLSADNRLLGVGLRRVRMSIRGRRLAWGGATE